MGTFTINIAAATTPIYTISSDINNACYSQKTVDVDHQGTDLYIKIFSSGTFANMNVTETITADKTYTLVVNGRNNVGGLNSSGVIVLEIRETNASGPLKATIFLQRTHDGTLC